MKNSNNWNQLKQSIYRAAIAFSFVVLMLFTTAAPASAFGFGNNQQSAPNEGVEKLDGIYEQAEEALENSGLQSMEEVQERSKKGINEVQGNADADKMNRPSNSRQATTIQDKAESALKKATQNR
ncbi:MAG: hypothetical protein Fur0046_18460 [Cyanobacteria bacterium J069]